MQQQVTLDQLLKEYFQLDKHRETLQAEAAAIRARQDFLMTALKNGIDSLQPPPEKQA